MIPYYCTSTPSLSSLGSPSTIDYLPPQSSNIHLHPLALTYQVHRILYMNPAFHLYNPAKAHAAPTSNAALTHCNLCPAAAPSNGTSALVAKVVFDEPLVDVVGICAEGSATSVDLASEMM